MQPICISMLTGTSIYATHMHFYAYGHKHLCNPYALDYATHMQMHHYATHMQMQMHHYATQLAINCNSICIIMQPN
jgi:hypothetical protein